MFCPLCGASLDEVEHEKEIEDPDWDDQAAVKAWQEAYEEPDESIWYSCSNCKSFGKGYELVHHYPLVGKAKDLSGKELVRTKPGDSWSLTWIK